LIWPLSYGVTISTRGSGADTLAHWFMAICCPYISTFTLSSMFGEAFPDRIFENSFFVCSMSLSIAVRASFTICGIVLI
jgi:hypothetical protein